MRVAIFMQASDRFYGPQLPGSVTVQVQLLIMAAFRRTAVTISYPLLGILENELRRREIRIADKAFAADVTLVLLLPKDTADSICSALVELTAGRCQLDEQGEEYLGLPICQPQQDQSD